MAIFPESITVDARDVLRRRTMVVNFSHLKSLKLRLWIGGKLVRLAAFVMGCGIEIKTGDNESKNIAQ